MIIQSEELSVKKDIKYHRAHKKIKTVGSTWRNKVIKRWCSIEDDSQDFGMVVFCINQAIPWWHKIGILKRKIKPNQSCNQSYQESSCFPDTWHMLRHCVHAKSLHAQNSLNNTNFPQNLMHVADCMLVLKLFQDCRHNVKSWMKLHPRGYLGVRG